MTHPRALSIAMLASFLLLANGCLLFVFSTGPATAPAGTRVVNGELRTEDKVSLDRAWDAARAAVRDLQFETIDARKDTLDGIVKARTANGKNVTIRLESRGGQQTEIRIRVGLLGDIPRSRQILERIRAGY